MYWSIMALALPQCPEPPQAPAVRVELPAIKRRIEPSPIPGGFVSPTYGVWGVYTPMFGNFGSPSRFMYCGPGGCR